MGQSRFEAVLNRSAVVRGAYTPSTRRNRSISDRQPCPLEGSYLKTPLLPLFTFVRLLSGVRDRPELAGPHDSCGKKTLLTRRALTSPMRNALSK